MTTHVRARLNAFARYGRPFLERFFQGLEHAVRAQGEDPSTPGLTVSASVWRGRLVFTGGGVLGTVLPAGRLFALTPDEAGELVGGVVDAVRAAGFDPADPDLYLDLEFVRE